MQKFDQEGFVEAHIRGFGFVVTGQGEKFFIPPALIRKLLPGDHVGILVVPGREPNTFQVGQLWLIERFKGSFLGVLNTSKYGTALDPDDACPLPLRVTVPKNYIEQDVVRVTTHAYKPENGIALALNDLPSYLDASIAQALGSRTRKDFEQDYALAKYRFTEAFPEQLTNACDLLAEDAATNGLPMGLREDLRNISFITIDSASTQDFDDALFAEKTMAGWRVLVAIADVSHYVSAGSALDACARERGTSVYLPSKTVPMLPKALSNGLCALKENVSRYAVVLEMALNDQGEVVSTRTTRAIINVDENMTYDQVQDLLNGSKDAPESSYPCLVALQELYYLRLAKAPLVITPGPESPEPSWSATDEGLSIVWNTRHVAHKIVECFMLLANQQIAKQLLGTLASALFRHQKTPTPLKWSGLVQWAQEQGYLLSVNPDRAALEEFSASLPPEAHLSGQLHIRGVMSSANYDELQSSHFSLGYDTYTHFTSPIRRYADLLVHRLILGETVATEELQLLAQHCSLRSRNAKSAERHVWDKLKKRVAVTNVSASSQFLGYVATQTRFGLRAIVLPWQCAVNVSGSSLASKGFKFNNATLQWNSSTTKIIKGSYLVVENLSIEEFKAKTEVAAHLSSVVGPLSQSAVGTQMEKYSPIVPSAA